MERTDEHLEHIGIRTRHLSHEEMPTRAGQQSEMVGIRCGPRTSPALSLLCTGLFSFCCTESETNIVNKRRFGLSKTRHAFSTRKNIL